MVEMMKKEDKRPLPRLFLPETLMIIISLFLFFVHNEERPFLQWYESVNMLVNKCGTHSPLWLAVTHLKTRSAATGRTTAALSTHIQIIKKRRSNYVY